VEVGQKVTLGDVAALRRLYIQSVGGRLEPYLEELLSHSGVTRELVCDGARAGYFCVGAEKTLLQFYVVDQHLPHVQGVFSRLIADGDFDKALALTRDRLALSACADFNKNLSVQCYVFEEGPEPPRGIAEFSNVAFRLATMEDVPAIRAGCGDFHDFLHYTLEGSIAKQEIFVLHSHGALLGTGVIGAREFQPPYVDIGMYVVEQHRGRGVGAQIVMLLRDYCRRQGWVSGASCQYSNTASRRTLEKGGMVSRDRVLRFEF
jgi:GNAT superfamily N-acetyltransferase